MTIWPIPLTFALCLLAQASAALEKPAAPRDPVAGLAGLESVLVYLESHGAQAGQTPDGLSWGRWQLRLLDSPSPGRHAADVWLADVGPITSQTCREVVGGDLPVGTRQIILFHQGSHLAAGNWPVGERLAAIDGICGSYALIPRLRLTISRRPYLGLRDG